MINTFIYFRSSFENYTRLQTNMGKIYTRFQTKKAQKTLPDLAAHTYIAYIREYPPGSLGGSIEFLRVFRKQAKHNDDFYSGSEPRALLCLLCGFSLDFAASS